MCCLRITHIRLSKELVKNTDPLGLQPRFTDSEFGAGVGPFHKCPGASNPHHKPKTTGGADLPPNHHLRSQFNTTCVTKRASYHTAFQLQTHLYCWLVLLQQRYLARRRKGLGFLIPEGCLHPSLFPCVPLFLSPLLLSSLYLGGQQHFPMGGFSWNSPGEGSFPASSVSNTPRLTSPPASGPQLHPLQCLHWRFSKCFFPWGLSVNRRGSSCSLYLLFLHSLGFSLPLSRQASHSQ